VKTAISIPDETFEAAERLAQRQGRSRSELYAAAVREYLKRHGHDGLTDRVNAAIQG
jgi:metal-responsive CopG/Arc/MetJ family transcriptional regulator